MTCTTCGRENPPHLTFCQECGQRLGPRIAPPTPPIGLGLEADTSEVKPGRVQTALGAAVPPPQGGLGATALVQNSPAAMLGATIANNKPPDFGVHPPPAPAGPPMTAAPAAAGGARRCRVCDTPNGPSLRYCTSCGSTLDAPGAAPPQAPTNATLGQPAPRLVEPAPVPMPVAQPGPIAPAPAPFGGSPAPIAPMRVVDLGTGGRADDRSPGGVPRTCTRCRGVVDGNAQFCKFCGAPLAEAVAPRDASMAPAQAPHATPAHVPAQNVAPVQVLSPAQSSPPAPQVAAYGPPPAQPQPAAAPYGPPPAPPYGMPPPPQPQQPHATPPHVPSHAPTPPPPQAAAPPLPPAMPPAKRPGSIPPPLPPQPPPTIENRANGPAPAAPSPLRGPSYAPPPAQPPPAVGPAPNPSASPPAPAKDAAPAPPKVTRGRLVVIAKSGADGPSYPIGDTMDVGRQEGQVIVGEDPYLSPRHVRIAWRNDRFYLRDLGSTNGVFLRLVAARDTSSKRGDPSGEVVVPLQDQDLILVGQQVLRFELVKDGEAGFGPATEHGTLLFGSPAAPRYARLGQRTVEGVTRDVYYVRKVETVLGRESGDVVFTEDPFLSRRHAAIRVLGPNGQPIATGTKAPPIDQLSFVLVDMGSSNGTFLKIRNEVELVPGDHFRVGQQLFRVDWDAQPSGGR